MKNLNLKYPFVMILVGHPLVGKTTWVKENFDKNDILLISRDEILMEVAGTMDYNLAYETVDQKLVDKELKSRLENAGKSDKNVIIDMTHMGSKRRKYNLSYFDDKFYKVAVVFPILDKSEYEVRNQERTLNENKSIPYSVVERMVSDFQSIKVEEGFNKVIVL